MAEDQGRGTKGTEGDPIKRHDALWALLLTKADEIIA